MAARYRLSQIAVSAIDTSVDASAADQNAVELLDSLREQIAAYVCTLGCTAGGRLSLMCRVAPSSQRSAALVAF
jgi:hypothetical protein